ncbi:MAG: DUF4440 domain-containing protein [bacterium]|nr:DUF4440 domain-containing protein [bacterium]MDI1337705.1 DUF4440 domain-containing protein [Lacunisphaera sp.]
MKLRIAPAFLFVLGLCAVLFPAVTAIAAELSPEGKALVKMDDAWSASAGKKDLDLLVSFYAEDATVYPPNDKVASGRAAIRAVWAGITDPNYALSWKATNAGVSGSELGFTSGTFVETVKGADGKATTATGKFLCVWKRQKDGSWKAIHDMWNYDAK